MVACAKGHDNVVIMLLKTQVNIDYQTSTGTTALHLCSQYGHENIVRQLLISGANRFLKDTSNQTPLDKANQFHRRKIEYLVQETMTAFSQISSADSDYGSSIVSQSTTSIWSEDNNETTHF